jgi:predicted amidohydrolase
MPKSKLPREVWVASIDLMGLWPEKSIEKRVNDVLARMESFVGLQPDIVCLPETFPTSWVQEKKTLNEVAEDEDSPGPITKRIAEYAKKHKCYVVSAMATKKDGHFYNSAVIIDRTGKLIGVFHKVHPTTGEIRAKKNNEEGGITPGTIRSPVFKTDFGKIGVQICYDANWLESWQYLKEDGAEIVFFPSQYPGGRMLNFHAMRNQYYVVSSTGEDARIVDMSGADIDSSSTFVRYVCAPINLEKLCVPVWPIRDRFPAIFKKYGRKIFLKVFDVEGFVAIESRDPDVKILNVLREFGEPTYDERIKNETEIQDKYRL